MERVVLVILFSQRSSEHDYVEFDGDGGDACSSNPPVIFKCK